MEKQEHPKGAGLEDRGADQGRTAMGSCPGEGRGAQRGGCQARGRLGSEKTSAFKT